MLHANQSTDLTVSNDPPSTYCSAKQRELQFVCSRNKVHVRSSADWWQYNDHYASL